MKIIAQGAEAKLYIDKLDNQRVLVKERIKKVYRLRQIDEKLRKTRTKAEAKLLTEARKLGVHTPKILKLTEDKIVMQFVDGKRVKELLNESDKKTVTKVCKEIGKNIGKLHESNIVHGDLTTSNMILSDGKVFFIDFGLGGFSKRIEDKAVDLKLLKESMQSTHWKILKDCWNNILKGYKQEYRDAERAAQKIEEIDKRARYAKR
jgi:TP53 regulating kinase-like protein